MKKNFLVLLIVIIFNNALTMEQQEVLKLVLLKEVHSSLLKACITTSQEYNVRAINNSKTGRICIKPICSSVLRYENKVLKEQEPNVVERLVTDNALRFFLKKAQDNDVEFFKHQEQEFLQGVGRIKISEKRFKKLTLEQKAGKQFLVVPEGTGVYESSNMRNVSSLIANLNKHFLSAYCENAGSFLQNKSVGVASWKIEVTVKDITKPDFSSDFFNTPIKELIRLGILPEEGINGENPVRKLEFSDIVLTQLVDSLTTFADSQYIKK